MNNENGVGRLWLGGDHNIVIRKNEAALNEVVMPFVKEHPEFV